MRLLVGGGPVPRCRRRPILAPTYQTSGGALLSTSETPEPVTNRSEVGGATEVHLLIVFANIHLFFKHQIFGGIFTLYRKRGAHQEPRAWINKREKDNLIKLVFKYKTDLYLMNTDKKCKWFHGNVLKEKTGNC